MKLDFPMQRIKKSDNEEIRIIQVGKGNQSILDLRIYRRGPFGWTATDLGIRIPIGFASAAVELDKIIEDELPNSQEAEELKDHIRLREEFERAILMFQETFANSISTLMDLPTLTKGR